MAGRTACRAMMSGHSWVNEQANADHRDNEQRHEDQHRNRLLPRRQGCFVHRAPIARVPASVQP